MTARFDIDARTVRFEYTVADGEPEKWIKLDGKVWRRTGWHALSYDASRGLVWYVR